MGLKSSEAVEMEKMRADATDLLTKIMFKLDSLTNSHFLARAPTLTPSANKDFAALKIEDTVPLIMATESDGRAPQERLAFAATGREEMSQDERRAMRGADKARRKKKVGGQVARGEIKLKALQERSAKLSEKNKVARDDVASKKSSGLSAAAAARQATQSTLGSSGGRLKHTDALAAAADRASGRPAAAEGGAAAWA
eukprot:Selendium_serpulae@DN2587_c2_g1_i1.p1